jgi:hypothetical protein
MHKSISALIMTAGLCQTANSQTLYTPREFCNTQQFGAWYSCEDLPGARSVTFLPNTITPTTNDFIKSLGVNNLVAYSFSCSATKPFYFGLSFADKKFPFAWNTSGSIQNLIAYDQQTTPYILEVRSPGRSTAMIDGCQVTVTANISKVPDEALRSYVNSQIRGASKLRSVSSQIKVLELLPAAWANLSSIKSDLELEIELLNLELQGQDSLSSQGLALAERKSLYENLSKTIADALQVADRCEGEATDTDTQALCLSTARTIAAQVDSDLNTQINELREIQAFIGAESTRLQAQDQDYSTKLNTIAQSLQKILK